MLTCESVRIRRYYIYYDVVFYDELIPVADASSYKDCRDSIGLTIIDQARYTFRGKKKILLTTTTEWINEKHSRIFFAIENR